MSLAKPITNAQLALSAIGVVKTATLVLTMLILEWARLRERKAKLEAAGAVADLAVANAKVEASHDKRTAAQVVDEYLRARGIPTGDRQG